MSTDEITTFREGRPEVPPYDPAAKAIARLRLFEEPAPRRARASGRRRLLTAGALTGALVVGITVVQNVEFNDEPGDGAGHPRRPLVLVPVANAEALAKNAAHRAESQPDRAPRPSQWSYVKKVYAQTREGGGPALFGTPKKKHTSEIWTQANGKRFAVLVNGKLQVGNGTKGVDYPHLLSLPTDPQKLLAYVYKEVDAQLPSAEVQEDALRNKGARATGQPAAPVKATDEQRNAGAFNAIEMYMRDAALPARLRAALYGALAKVPGVRYEAKASDLAGRPGVTLYRELEGYLRGEIFIDPKTYAYLGFRFIAFRDLPADDDHPLPAKKGQIIGWGGLLKAAVVDRPGKRS